MDTSGCGVEIVRRRAVAVADAASIAVGFQSGRSSSCPGSSAIFCLLVMCSAANRLRR